MPTLLPSLALLTALLAGCQTPPTSGATTGAIAATAPATRPASSPPDAGAGVTYAGGDGSSIENAVVVLTKEPSPIGIRAEYTWLASKYPGYQRLGQKLIRNGGKPYDVLDIVTPEGRKTSVYFEISSFFGRF